MGRLGPEVWSRFLVEHLPLKESRAGREGFLGVAFQASAGSFQLERRVRPQRDPIGKGRVGLECQLRSVGCGVVQWVQGLLI